MKYNIDKENIGSFMKTGIVVLSFFVLSFLGIKYIPAAVTVTSHTNSKELPIYSVETEEKKVALTFDAAWGNEDLDEILGILDKYDVTATFFMTGEWVEKYPEDVKRFVAKGHDLGNHGENHKHMSKLSFDECKDEIRKNHDKVKKLTGIDMNLFRPPYGEYNNTVIHSAKELGYHSIQWDVDSLDWKDYGVKDIIKQCTQNKNLKNGSILLLHNGTKYTAQALENIILGLQDQGYTLVPISKLIYNKDYTVDLTGRQHKK